MDTPQDQLNSWRKMEENEARYKNPTNDPQFSEMMDLFSTLIEKYGKRAILILMRNDYRYEE